MAPRDRNDSRKPVPKCSDLLKIARPNLRSIRTKIIQLPTIDNGNMCIFRAEVTMRYADGEDVPFEATGDASPASLRDDMRPHLIRIAETRAVVRALRWAVGEGDAAAEELQDYSEGSSGNGRAAARPTATATATGDTTPTGKPINTTASICACGAGPGKAHATGCTAVRRAA